MRPTDPASLPCFDNAAPHGAPLPGELFRHPSRMQAPALRLRAAPQARKLPDRFSCGARGRPASLLCLPALTVPPRQGRSRCGARGCACRSCARTWQPASATTCRRRARRSCGTCSARRAAACSCTRGSARCAPVRGGRPAYAGAAPTCAGGGCGAAGLLRGCGRAGCGRAAGVHGRTEHRLVHVRTEDELPPAPCSALWLSRTAT